MKKVLAVLVHAAVLAAALRASHSTGEFLVGGVGLALLLDRYALRLLPWDGPVVWGRELGVRAAYAVAGAAGIYLVRHGTVPVREAVTVGVALSLLTFLLESALGLVRRVRRRQRGQQGQGQPAAWRRVLRRGLSLALLAPLAPLLAFHPPHTVPERTPAAFGLAFEDVRFRTADGMELAGWLVPHPQARGNVIFCHGHGRNRGHCAGFLQTLHGLRLNVLAFDFRGHGDSPGHTATFGHREVEDLVAAEAYLRGRCPGQPLFLVGISYGGAVALQALQRLPDVQGVWCEGSFSTLESVLARQIAWLPGGLREGVAAWCDALIKLDCGCASRELSPLAHLGRVTTPVHFCHACGDRLIPFTDAIALYAAHAGPRWYYWVEGARHYNPRQRDRAAYLGRLHTFLEGRLAEATAARPQ